MLTTILNVGVDLEAKNKNGSTALMIAAGRNPNPEVINKLLDAGANARAEDNEGRLAIDYAQVNQRLKGTDAYRRLLEASKPRAPQYS